MWSNAKYILVYLGGFIAFGILSYFLADRFNRFAHRSSKSRIIDKITFLIFVSLVGISLILPYFMLQAWPGVFPPFLKKLKTHAAIFCWQPSSRVLLSAFCQLLKFTPHSLSGRLRSRSPTPTLRLLT